MQRPLDPFADDTEDHLEESSPAVVKQREGTLRLVTRHIWNPVPIPRPRIDPHLDELSWPERSVEVISFTLLSIEHWISQGGVLREWLRLNLWVAVLLSFVAILLVPPVTALLEGAAEWSAIGDEIVENVTTAFLRLPPMVIALATLLLFVKLLQKHWTKRKEGGRYENEEYGRYR